MNFEKATRLKLRFETTKGNVTVEDLWDLPVTARMGVSLESIARKLDAEIKNESAFSFVSEKTTTNNLSRLKFDIVKHIADVRLLEIETKENKMAKDLKREKLLTIIENKENNSLENMSVEDLKKMIAEL